MTTETPSTTHRPCPSHEFLVAAVTGALSDGDERWLDIHLAVCDRCVEAVDVAVRRLRIADEIPAHVPETVRRLAARAAAQMPPSAVPPPGTRTATVRPATAWLSPRWRNRGRRWAGALRRPPALVPAALAAGAVLVVAVQDWTAPTAPPALTRSIELPRQVRVTAPQAPIHRQPSRHAEVLATVTRGTPVAIGGTEREWSQVTLPDGTVGWIDQRALQ